MEKYLVIGLGSMGKRRIRCLLALGIEKAQIYGMDIRADRRKESYDKYGICTVENEGEINFDDIKAVIVSLPPDKHFLGVKIALEHNKPVFVEASVVLDDVERIKKFNSSGVFVAPSCTFNFHPMIKAIAKLVNSNEYGKVCNFSYHSGQFLPDWHPWENVRDYYVGNRLTGGAREIVPFELTWIANIFGLPKGIKGYFRKTADVGCDIEDSYVCVIDYENMVGNLTVDVVSRYAVRNLIINFQEAHLQWNWDKKRIEIYSAKDGKWHYIDQPKQIHQQGYNENINEDMYIEEVESFLKGINDNNMYGNTIEKDILILKLLKELEDSDQGFDR